DFLGPLPFLANVTVVFVHPARTVGAMLEVTASSIMGAILATVWILPRQAVEIAINKRVVENGGQISGDATWVVEAVWFFIGIWIMTTLKAKYPKLTSMFLIFTTAHIFEHGRALDNTSFDFQKDFWAWMTPMMLGVAICLVTCVVIWPETASDGLGRALYESLDSSRALLSLSTRMFLLHHRTIAQPLSVMDNAHTQVKQAQKKLHTAYKEARYEVTYSEMDPAGYKEARFVLTSMMRHLGSMSLVVRNERLTMLARPQYQQREEDVRPGSGDANASVSEDDGTHGQTSRGRDGGGHLSENDGSRDGSISHVGPVGASNHPQEDSIQPHTRECPTHSPRRPSRADELNRIRQLFLRAENRTGISLAVRQEQQRRCEQTLVKLRRISSARARAALRRKSFNDFLQSSTPVMRSSPTEIASSRHGQDDSGTQVGPSQHGTSRNHSSNAQRAFTTTGVEEPTAERRRRLKQIWKAYKRAERADKIEKKRLAKERSLHENDPLTASVPRKEFVSGDQRLFILFLDMVRAPLQRLSNACCLAILAIEQNVVSELNVEKDRKEWIRQQESKKAIALKKSKERKEEEEEEEEENGLAQERSRTEQDVEGGVTGAGRASSRWTRIRDKLASCAKSFHLAQDPTDEPETDTQSRRRRRLSKSSRSGKSLDSIHPNAFQLGTEGASGSIRMSFGEALGDLEDNAADGIEREILLPAGISLVQYLKQELEAFDNAEAESLKRFTAKHSDMDIGLRQELFLIFFFLFAMRETAKELVRLAKHDEELEAEVQSRVENNHFRIGRKKLWWPKVVGNFWKWVSWGTYSQARSNEGYTGALMNSNRNLDSQQPRLVEEERARVQAKEMAKMAAKEAQSGSEGLQERNNDARGRMTRENILKLQRSKSMSAAVNHRQQAEDLCLDLSNSRDSQEATSNLWFQMTSLNKIKSHQPKLQTTEFLDQDFNRREHSFSHSNQTHVSETREAESGPATHRPITQPLMEHRESSADDSFAIVDIPEFHPFHVQDTGEGNALGTNDGLGKGEQTEAQAVEPPLNETNNYRARNIHATTKAPQPLAGDHPTLPSGAQATPTRAQQQPGAVAPLIFVNGCQEPKTWRYRLWEAIETLKSAEVKYGLKMAAGLTLIGLWTWLRVDVDSLVANRDVWAMMTVMAGLSPTIGATLRVVGQRVLGTIVGVAWAIVTYVIAPGSPYPIAFMFIPFSLVVAFLILETPNPMTGIVMMLTYSSAILAPYHSQIPETFYALCLIRALTVTAGILVAVLFNTCLWPLLARKELRKEISMLVGRQGVLFAELMSTFLLDRKPVPRRASRAGQRSTLHQPQDIDRDTPEVGSQERSPLHKDENGMERRGQGVVRESAEVIGGSSTIKDRSGELKYEQKEQSSRPNSEVLVLTGHGSKQVDPPKPDQPEQVESPTGPPPVEIAFPDHEYDDDDEDPHAFDSERLAFQRVENQLQAKLLQIDLLLKLSDMEPRLKGKFPTKLYQRIGQCCQNILDRIVSMRTSAQLLSPEVWEVVTGPMSFYRRDMTPVPPYLPSARLARWRVVQKVREAIFAYKEATGKTQYTFIYYYAFSSALEEVIEELELLAILVRPVVGIIYGSSHDEYIHGASNYRLDSSSTALPTSNFFPDPSQVRIRYPKESHLPPDPDVDTSQRRHG
ncbi:hypothetical protein BGW38_009787, partial [Lunasporangiospora selenospora]